MRDKPSILNFDLSKPEDCYILGYFWADCCFSKYKRNDSFGFSFEINSDDFLLIWPILQKIGFDKYSTRFRKNSPNPQSCVRAHRQADMGFFLKYKFNNKNNGCPLYFDLNEEMKSFFVKGFLDGDGSVSFDRNNLFRVSFNGSINQNWDFIEDYLLRRNIDYVLYRKTRKMWHPSHTQDHGYSILEPSGIKDRINFCLSIQHCNLGIKRKLDEFFAFKDIRLKNQATSNNMIVISFDFNPTILSSQDVKQYLAGPNREVRKLTPEQVKKRNTPTLCIRCNDQIRSDKKTCTPCSKILKEERIPSKEILTGLIEKMSFDKIGEKYNVCGQTIRNWCKKRGLELGARASANT